MDELTKEYVISFYNKNLLMHGDRPEAVRWTSEGQRLHYECLLEIDSSIAGSRVLDYGCGKGDLYQFLNDKSISVHYTGFDINDKLISLARAKFPGCRFEVFDIEKDLLDEDFDYIFLCGVFNLKVEGLHETIKSTLKKLFDHCRIALAYNGLSAHNPRKDFELNYVFPEEITEFAVKDLSPFVKLIHDRIPYDFIIFINRDIRK
jgi:SAM-dependent methyltransferase